MVALAAAFRKASAQQPVYVLQTEGSTKQQKLALCQFVCVVRTKDWFSLHEMVVEVSLTS